MATLYIDEFCIQIAKDTARQFGFCPVIITEDDQIIIIPMSNMPFLVKKAEKQMKLKIKSLRKAAKGKRGSRSQT